MAIVNARALVGAGCLGLLALTACSRQGRDEMSWARAALERNERIEVVAADPQSRTFTVRMKDTGELRMVRADQVIAGAAASPGSAASSPNTAPQTATTAAPVAPAPVPAAAGAAPAAPASGAAQDTEPKPPEEAAEAAQPRPFVSAALHAGTSTRPVPGQVLEAGPGYSIEAGGVAVAMSAGRGREAGVTRAPVERRHEPIVCQGARLLHIDNRNIEFDGDAVSAEDGCEIHITNSRISATGVGVSARAANVHIDNSLIEGDAASIDASDGAQIYTAASRFRGLSRRLDTAAVHDLGGNVWN
ncbi:MAG: hypothetical protein ACRETS_03735 [Steroidobacteraceae bacterium]